MQLSQTGLASSGIDGVNITPNEGDLVALRATPGTTRRAAVVIATGAFGEISPC